MKRILLIDDNLPFLAVQALVLRGAGYEVTTAEHGREGAKLLAGQRFDLVVTDLVMPEKDGIEVILELRRRGSPIKIIAISGGGRVGPENYLYMAGKLGAAATLTKPFSSDTLLTAVAGLLAAPAA